MVTKTQTYIKKWKVDITEYERGWGQRPDGNETFDSLKDAEEFVAKYNARNNLNYVPDIYWVAGEPYEYFEEMTKTEPRVKVVIDI